MIPAVFYGIHRKEPDAGLEKEHSGLIFHGPQLQEDSGALIRMNDTWKKEVEGQAEDFPTEMQEPFNGALFHWEREPTLMGRLEDATSYGRITGSCGETMEFYLKIEEDRIVDVRFFSDGCRASKACGSVTAELARGRSIDEAILIGGDTVLMVLQGLPQEDVHCAHLAAEALHEAIHRWMLH